MATGRWELQPNPPTNASPQGSGELVWARAREKSGRFSWTADQPPVPEVITRAARVLRRAQEQQGAETPAISLVLADGSRWRLQGVARSQAPHVRDAVVALEQEVVPEGAGAPLAAEEHADLCAWMMGDTAVQSLPVGPRRTPWHEVPISLGGWRALLSDTPLAQVIRMDWRLDEPCGFIAGPVDVLRVLRQAGLRILEVVHTTPLDDVHQQLSAWIDSTHERWDLVRGLVPPRPVIGDFLAGGLDADALREVIGLVAWLWESAANLPIDGLMQAAEGLDGLGVAHRLRRGTWREDARRSGLTLELGDGTIAWVTGPMMSWSITELVALGSGAHAAWLPDDLRQTRHESLSRRGGGPERWLFWYLRGVPVAPEQFDQTARLEPVLDLLAEHAPPADPEDPWMPGLLTLAEREVALSGARLSAALALRVAQAVGSSGRPGAALVCRCLALTSPAEREALLGALHVRLRSLRPPERWLRHRHSPIPRQLSPAAHGGPS